MNATSSRIEKAGTADCADGADLKRIHLRKLRSLRLYLQKPRLVTVMAAYSKRAMQHLADGQHHFDSWLDDAPLAAASGQRESLLRLLIDQR